MKNFFLYLGENWFYLSDHCSSSSCTTDDEAGAVAEERNEKDMLVEDIDIAIR